MMRPAARYERCLPSGDHAGSGLLAVGVVDDSLGGDRYSTRREVDLRHVHLRRPQPLQGDDGARARQTHPPTERAIEHRDIAHGLAVDEALGPQIVRAETVAGEEQRAIRRPRHHLVVGGMRDSGDLPAPVRGQKHDVPQPSSRGLWRVDRKPPAVWGERHVGTLAPANGAQLCDPVIDGAHEQDLSRSILAIGAEGNPSPIG